MLNQDIVDENKDQNINGIPEKKAIKNEIDAVEDLLLDDFSFEDNNSEEFSDNDENGHQLRSHSTSSFDERSRCSSSVSWSIQRL